MMVYRRKMLPLDRSSGGDLSTALTGVSIEVGGMARDAGAPVVRICGFAKKDYLIEFCRVLPPRT